MFTGIIKAVATITDSKRVGGDLILKVAKPKSWRINTGDSIATNGACLTVERVATGYYFCRLMPETLQKTTFGLVVPERVNLEPALKLGEELGGHLVTGHVDTVGKIIDQTTTSTSQVMTVQFSKDFSGLLAPKGSVTIDGVSLTVVDVKSNSFTVSLVEYTLKHTTLGERGVGDSVNLEFDILAKYVAAQHP